MTNVEIKDVYEIIDNSDPVYNHRKDYRQTWSEYFNKKYNITVIITITIFVYVYTNIKSS
jgi:hypothetical protein